MSGTHKVEEDFSIGQVVLIPRTRIKPDPDQPRYDFDADRIKELRDSIRSRKLMNKGLFGTGILKPLQVRLAPGSVDAEGKLTKNASYILYDGERRWLAAEGLLHELPVIIEDLNAEEAFDQAVEMAMQQEDYTPMEKGLMLKSIQNQKQFSLAQLADYVKRDKSFVQRHLQLIDLGEDAQELVWRDKKSLAAAIKIDQVKEPGLRATVIDWYKESRPSTAEVNDYVNNLIGRSHKGRKKTGDAEAIEPGDDRFSSPRLTVIKGGQNTEPNFGTNDGQGTDARGTAIDLGFNPGDAIDAAFRQIQYLSNAMGVYEANGTLPPARTRKLVKEGIGGLRAALDILEATVTGIKDGEEAVA